MASTGAVKRGVVGAEHLHAAPAPRAFATSNQPGAPQNLALHPRAQHRQISCSLVYDLHLSARLRTIGPLRACLRSPICAFTPFQDASCIAHLESALRSTLKGS